jgi:hypothetical protein
MSITQNGRIAPFNGIPRVRDAALYGQREFLTALFNNL